jgi:hypothetical protein
MVTLAELIYKDAAKQWPDRSGYDSVEKIHPDSIKELEKIGDQAKQISDAFYSKNSLLVEV